MVFLQTINSVFSRGVFLFCFLVFAVLTALHYGQFGICITSANFSTSQTTPALIHSLSTLFSTVYFRGFFYFHVIFLSSTIFGCFFLYLTSIKLKIFFIMSRDGPRTDTISKMELFVIIVKGFHPLTIIRKSSMLNVGAVLDPPLMSTFYLELLYALLPVCSLLLLNLLSVLISFS